MVSSIGQIELFNHLLYLNPFNCVQTNEEIESLTQVQILDKKHLHFTLHKYI